MLLDVLSETILVNQSLVEVDFVDTSLVCVLSLAGQCVSLGRRTFFLIELAASSMSELCQRVRLEKKSCCPRRFP